jgi:hypothetical protein
MLRSASCATLRTTVRAASCNSSAEALIWTSTGSPLRSLTALALSRNASSSPAASPSDGRNWLM